MSGKKPVNCLPCAKRKVRCDRSQPCNHCQRRKGDRCVYPASRVNESASPRDDQAERIDKLETYIRHLGGDPVNFESVDLAANGTSMYTTIEARRIQDAASTSSPRDSSTYTTGTEPLMGERRDLIEHDDQVTYIEAPMWFSWSEVNKPQEGPQVPAEQEGYRAKPKPGSTCCFPALLDPTNIVNSSLHQMYPPAPAMTALWKIYLKNVHPLVALFFDWEVEAMINKALHHPTRMAHGEQALVFAIFFIATLSLSEEQCNHLLHDKRSQLLGKFQRAVEESLQIAEFFITSDRLVLQAFMLYLLVMRTRTVPAAISSLLGIASRIAERMGLHHDGGVSVLRNEERRRIWWQLQHMEIAMGHLFGSITMTVYADWDTKLPTNLEDADLSPDIETLPPARRGLTTISSSLWRYQMLHMQLAARHATGSKQGLSLNWMLSKDVQVSDKDAMIDTCEKALGEQFLQYCEPLNPLHVDINISVRSTMLAARRLARQPALMNAKISEMAPREREDFLSISTKSMEYYILSQTTESIRGYTWLNNSWFQWSAFVYIILEAHHRFENDAVEDLWSLIGRVYAVHPRLMTATQHPDIGSIAHITLAAWQRRYTHLRQSSGGDSLRNMHEPPEWIVELRRKLDLPDIDSVLAPNSAAGEPTMDVSQLLPLDFDFDMIDWSVWEDPSLDAVF